MCNNNCGGCGGNNMWWIIILILLFSNCGCNGGWNWGGCGTSCSCN